MNWQTSCIRHFTHPIRCTRIASGLVILAFVTSLSDQEALKVPVEPARAEISPDLRPDPMSDTIFKTPPQPGNADLSSDSSRAIAPASGVLMEMNPRRLRPAEADVASTALALNSEDLGVLNQGDTLVLILPTGDSATLIVRNIRQTMGMRTLSLTDGQLSSTLTLRGEHFFGTIASRTGTFSLEGTELGSRLWSQRELNYRWPAGREDYRHVPLG